MLTLKCKETHLLMLMHLIFRTDIKKKRDQTAFSMHVSIPIWHCWLLLPSWNIFFSWIVYHPAVFVLLPRWLHVFGHISRLLFPEPQCQIPSHPTCYSSPSTLTPYVTLSSLMVSNATSTLMAFTSPVFPSWVWESPVSFLNTLTSMSKMSFKFNIYKIKSQFDSL